MNTTNLNSQSSKPRRIGIFVCAVMFFLTLWLPVVEMNTYFVRPMRLQNLRKPKKPVAPSIETFSSTEFQKKVALWFLRTHGFWGHMVRFDNQLNLELFNQISSKYKSSLVVGENKWLFQREYLNHFNRVSIPGEKTLRTRAAKLARLQELLKARGIGFAVLLSGGKVETYPKLVPAQYYAPKRDVRASTYSRILTIYSELGIEIIDSIKFFREREASNPAIYFTPSGSHWNDVGACSLVSEIALRMQDFLQKPITQLDCTTVVRKPKPNQSDLDLVIMANLFNRQRYLRETPYPKPVTNIPENVYKPKMLVIGTSYGWSIMRFLNNYKIFRDSNFWYYYRKARNYPTKRQYPLRRAEIKWERDLLGADFVLIEANMMGLSNVGFGFVVDALAVLEKSAQK